MIKKISGGILILASLTLLSALASPTTSASKEDFSYCLTCHGAQGNGNPAIQAPKIAGMEPWYVRKQLEQFRAGVRGTSPLDHTGQEMRPIAAALAEPAEIDGAVRYAAAFKPKAPPVTVTGDHERGRTLYEICAACHGARGEGNSALHAPALANQSDWYLVTQLERYRSGARGFSADDIAGAQMRVIAVSLPDSNAITDVVAFINTLR